MLFTSEKTVSEIVQNDYRAADVFKKFGINFCCSGKIGLAEACAITNTNFDEVVAALEIATRNVFLSNNIQYNLWTLDFLTDYIVNIHHAYLRHALPEMEVRLLSFVETHGRKQPHLQQLLDLFLQFTNLVKVHLEHEEEIIFPYIRQIEGAHRRNEPYGNLFVRTLRKPLHAIEKEDAQINGLLKQMQSLTNNFSFPATACTNHQVVFHKLRELYNDVVQHQYLENAILFPRALEIEQQLLNVY